MNPSIIDGNRLADTSSPYLRQHAGNPVHWQPWDAATLAYAKETDTPILLSIGYSACHWCHVMAHECFENPQIATLMNAGFVNIKLDREERPDIDRVYQLAHQALSGRGGGWPLTAFLDPQDLAPFYIGTYFPPTPRHGLPGFPEVLQRVRAFFDQHRSELRAQAEQLRGWLQHADSPTSDAAIDADTANRTALQRIGARFDPDWGGNTGAPKFPRASELEWLLDRACEPLSLRERGRGEGSHPENSREKSDPHPALRATTELLAMDGGCNQGEKGNHFAQLTLARMATRGLQDHLGGGFFRYCVDADWTIPHFEKMLYDNAQLLPAYARLAADPQTPRVDRDTAMAAAQGIADWLARDMTAPGGAFHSSLDADSEHEEGRFYLWTREEVHAVLGDSGFELAATAYGLDSPPNFEGCAWHLLRDTPSETLAARFGESPEATAARLAGIRLRLLDARAHRIPPARDDKILTAWNALAIAGLARSARLLDDARCATMAQRALAALRESAWIDGALYANTTEPAARIPGFLDDHAFLLDALLETLQLEFRRDDLDWAIALADALCEKFADPDAGGFWFSTAQHATPLARSRNWTDDALPNGNAMAIRSLLRLGHLVGNTRWLDAAERALRAASGALAQYPDACPSLLRALAEFEKPRAQIVVRCPATQCDRWRAALRDGLRDAGIVPGNGRVDAFIIPDTAGTLPGLLSERVSRNDSGTAWVCSGLTCQAPVTSPDGLRGALGTR